MTCPDCARLRGERDELERDVARLTEALDACTPRPCGAGGAASRCRICNSARLHLHNAKAVPPPDVVPEVSPMTRREFVRSENDKLGRFLGGDDLLVGWRRTYRCDCGFACYAPGDIWDHRCMGRERRWATR